MASTNQSNSVLRSLFSDSDSDSLNGKFDDGALSAGLVEKSSITEVEVSEHGEASEDGKRGSVSSDLFYHYFITHAGETIHTQGS